MSAATASASTSNSFMNTPHWRQMLLSITQRNQHRNSTDSTNNPTNLKLTADGSNSAPSRHAASSALPVGLSILTCCVTPQSNIGRVRIDRSMISRPSDFRHIGHMGANDLGGSYNEEALNSLLSSKGDDEFRIPVPKNFRAKDVPISEIQAYVFQPQLDSYMRHLHRLCD